MAMGGETPEGPAGEPFDARRAEISALTIRLGADHPQTLQKRLMSARELLERGSSGEASEESASIRADTDQAAQRFRDHEIVFLRRMLVDLFLHLGKLEEAAAEQQSVAVLHRRIFGADHAQSIGSQANLATMLLRTGDRQRAAEEAGRALTAAVCVLGSDHVITATARATLTRAR